MPKVLISGNKKIKFRKAGLETWTTLTSGVTHILDVDFDSTYEFYSSVLSKVTIVGQISNLVIEDSTLSDIEKSFKNNYFLTRATINTSGVIESASYAFENNLSLEELSITGLNENSETDEIVKGTLSMNNENYIFIGIEKDSRKMMFGSSIKEELNKLYSADTVSMSTNIKTDGVLDLTNLKFDRDKLRDFADSNVLKDVDIVSVAGSVVRKKYEPSTFNKSRDDGYDFEIDLKKDISISYLVNNNDKVKSSSFNEAINSNYDFEIDLKQNVSNSYLVNNNDKVKSSSFETNIDNNYNFEMDLKQNVSNSYLVNNNDKVKIPYFDDTIDSNYNFEMDLIPAYTLEEDN